MIPALTAKNLPIFGLKLIHLDVRHDARGWFQENWQSVKFAELGLANFFPIQSNVSSNEEVGTTRGLHAEPWNKLVTITSGSAFAAWVDLRKGDEFGKVFFLELSPGTSVFIPAGVANGFQTTSPFTTYSYLVDGHWSPEVTYKTVNAFDPKLAILWPIQQPNAILSPKDALLGAMSEVAAFEKRPILLLGSNGKVGKALFEQFPEAIRASRRELMTAFDRGTLKNLVPNDGIILNAAAFTNVDECETAKGYKEAIVVNYQLVQRLAEAANAKFATLVHFSTDYVFDGEKESPYTETDLPNPINKYGITKLLGDLAAQTAKRHYIFRVSWVYGLGGNFIKTMANKAFSGESVGVVTGQRGRPTSSNALARAVCEHLKFNTPFGIYNISDSGAETSWHEMARQTYKTLGFDPERVGVPQTKAGSSITSLPAERPKNSMLNNSKSVASGQSPLQDWETSLRNYLHILRDR
jgi:dTDP-4-dehydrorhamnose 3,5-epimerase